MLVIRKSAAFVPVTVTLLTVSEPVPVLLTVTGLGELVVFTVCDEKLRLLGLTFAFGAITVPLTGMVCGLPGALSCKVSTAEKFPVLLG